MLHVMEMTAEKHSLLRQLEGLPPDAFVLCAAPALAPEGHPAISASLNWAKGGYMLEGSVQMQPLEPLTKLTGLAALRKLAEEVPENVNGFVLPVAHVEDQRGHLCRRYTLELCCVRASYLRTAVTKGTLRWGSEGIGFKHMERGRVKNDAALTLIPVSVVVPEAPLLHWPLACRAYTAGNYLAAMTYAENAMNGSGMERDPLLRRTYRLARAAEEQEAALAAFKVLFEHYSFNEELWRLREWVNNYLPFTLEELPEMEQYRRLLDEQVGHIDDLTKHYSEDTPFDVCDEGYVRVAHLRLAPRYRWLIEQCRAKGLKKVAELGSVNGISLFPLIQAAPDIEWHGFEVSEKAVEHGNALAQRMGLGDRFHLHHVARLHETHGPLEAMFDAAFVFEVLEHNSPYDAEMLLHAADSYVQQNGYVFVTTPHGNWSICDEKTRDLHLRKDHINAFTVKRMRDLLKASRAHRDVQVEQVENPDFWEANSQVFASYRVDHGINAK